VEYYSALKKKEILHYLTAGKKLEDIMLSETSQSPRDKYCTIPLKGGVYNRLREANGKMVLGHEELLLSVFSSSCARWIHWGALLPMAYL